MVFFTHLQIANFIVLYQLDWMNKEQPTFEIDSFP